MKDELWVTVKLEFAIDVSDWFVGEGLTKAQRIKKIEEELSDYSVFMSHINYGNLQSTHVKVD